ncbi:MAG: 5-formyltetrahydrofolate cyclo-ligase [Clostridia bacterium]|nr:5-formyltetrahydrofolate cyclo-ligase [Clostridia bacterium]
MMCESIAAQKAEKRKHFRTVRDGIPPAQREIDSEIIAEKVLALIQEKQIKRVFVYLSIGSEVHTHSLIAKLLSLGVTVGVPRCDKVTHKMDAIVIQDLEQLQTGAYGILEPKDGPILPPEQVELILLPALAFAKDGTRLGYGGGYYDRYTQDFHGLMVGLAFSACLTENLPKDAFDKPVDLVITEKIETEER